MTKLKTTFLLVLAGFILVACGPNKPFEGKWEGSVQGQDVKINVSAESLVISDIAETESFTCVIADPSSTESKLTCSELGEATIVVTGDSLVMTAVNNPDEPVVFSRAE